MRHDEVQKTPELLEAVLQRGACNEHSEVGVELHEGLVQERVIVLEPVSLVHHQYGPRQTAQEGLVLEHNFVRCQHGVELEPLGLESPLIVANLSRNRTNI